MAIIAPKPAAHGNGNLFSWLTVTPTDTMEALRPNSGGPLGGAVQITGTLGGASVGLSGSNDGTNWAPLNDLAGSPIALTAATQMAEFSSGALYVKPVITGGAAYSINVLMMLRG